MKNQQELAPNKLPSLANDIKFSQFISAISNENSLLMGKEQKSLIIGITYLQHLIAEITKKPQLPAAASNYLLLNSVLIIVEYSRLLGLNEKNPNVKNLLTYLSFNLNCDIDKLSRRLAGLIKSIDISQIDVFYIRAAKKIEYAFAVAMQALFHKDFELDIFSKLFNQLILLGTSTDDQERKKAAVEISGIVFSELNRLKSINSAKVSYLCEDFLINLHEFILKESLDSRYENLDVSQRKAMFGSWGKLQAIVEEINNAIGDSLLFGSEYKLFAAMARRFAELKNQEKSKMDMALDFRLKSDIEFFWNISDDNSLKIRKIVQKIKEENNLSEIKLDSSLSPEQKILFCEKLIAEINNPRFLPLDSEWAEYPVNYYASKTGKFSPEWSSNWFGSKVIVSAGPSSFDNRDWDMEHFINLVISCKLKEVLALGTFGRDFWLYIPKELLSESCPKNTEYTMEVQGKNTKFIVSGKKINEDICEVTFKDGKSSQTFYFSNIRVSDNFPVYLDNLGIAKWHSFCVNTTEQNPSLIHCASGVGRSGQMNEEFQLFSCFNDKAIFRLIFLKLLYNGDLSVVEKTWLKENICLNIMDIRQIRYQIHPDSQGMEIFPQVLLTVGFDLGIKDEKLNSLREAIYYSRFQTFPKNITAYNFGCSDASLLGKLLSKSDKQRSSGKQETYSVLQQTFLSQSDSSKVHSMEKPVVPPTTEPKQTFTPSETTVAQANMQQFFEAIKNNNNYKDIEKLLNEKELDLKITHEGKKALYYAAQDPNKFLIFNLLVTKVDVKRWNLSAEELSEIKKVSAKEGSTKMKKTCEALEKKFKESVSSNTSEESARSINELH